MTKKNRYTIVDQHNEETVFETYRTIKEAKKISGNFITGTPTSCGISCSIKTVPSIVRSTAAQILNINNNLSPAPAGHLAHSGYRRVRLPPCAFAV